MGTNSSPITHHPSPNQPKQHKQHGSFFFKHRKKTWAPPGQLISMQSKLIFGTNCEMSLGFEIIRENQPKINVQKIIFDCVELRGSKFRKICNTIMEHFGQVTASQLNAIKTYFLNIDFGLPYSFERVGDIPTPPPWRTGIQKSPKRKFSTFYIVLIAINIYFVLDCGESFFPPTPPILPLPTFFWLFFSISDPLKASIWQNIVSGDSYILEGNEIVRPYFYDVFSSP